MEGQFKRKIIEWLSFKRQRSPIMSYYEYEGTDPSQCVRFTFDKVLSASEITVQRHEELMRGMNAHENRWNAKYLLQGPKSGIQELTLLSLEKKARESWSEGRFYVRRDEDALVIINAKHKQGLEPLCVWRVGHQCYLIDYQQRLDALLPFIRERGVVQVFLGFEEHRKTMQNRWRKHRATVHCSHCDRDYALERCGFGASISEEGSKLFAVFTCPASGIGSMDSIQEQ